MIDPERQLAIRRDGMSGWRVVNGNGVILKAGFESNAQALAWVERHDTIARRHAPR